MSRRPGPEHAGALYRQTREAWARIWGDADLDVEQQTRDYARSREIRDRYRPYLPAGAWILEAGCGLGVELLALAGEGRRVVGLDYVEGALARMRARWPAVALAAGDVHALPFQDGALGAYLSFGVLEHFEFGPAPALREAHRVLRPGGVLVVTVPAPNPVWRLVRQRRRWCGTGPAAESYYETAYTADELARVVRGAGFEVSALCPVGHSFTLWGLGGPFRRPGYYRTSWLAERLGALLARVMPRTWSFATLLVARKGAA